jgi:NAD(P)-dependent dehydrogenase (short-subunit alcohol dehydrogenase family)
LPLSKMTAEAWDQDFAVNVRSHMLFAQKALELMAPGGAIILMSSMASQRANGYNPAYESSKAAQIALGRAIARAGEEKGVRCNVIAPGFMDTPMGRDASRRRADRAVTVPFGRQGAGWEVAYAALFLISNESSYVNAQTLFLDGGHLAGIVRA